MKILVFGKNGQVAQCLGEEAGGYEVALLGREECDLMVEGAGAAAIASHEPDIVINAAAYTAVDKAEEDTEAAARLNETAPRELAIAATAAEARFIHISTDYVFDGAAERSYSEDDPVNPLNVYGATKRNGEVAILDACPDAVIMRTSWVFSEFGGNFVKTMLRLGGERPELNIVGDQVGGPTPARDIAMALILIAGKLHRGAPGGGIYHYQGAPPASWADFAKEIFSASGHSVTVNEIATAEFPTPAQRPLRTILDCARIERDFGLAAPDWRAGLVGVVDRLTDRAKQG